jgi:protein MpaA
LIFYNVVEILSASPFSIGLLININLNQDFSMLNILSSPARLICLALTGVFLLTVTGCQQHKTASTPRQLRYTEPARYLQNKTIAGRSAVKRPIHICVLGKGSKKIFIMAGIHGNEPAGIPLVYQLEKHLLNNPELISGKTVILMPVANPDGTLLNTRENANGVDLNRNFPAAGRINSKLFGFSPLSEPESRTIASVIEQYKPSAVISIHQPYGCVDYDGPGRKLANQMSLACSLPFRKLGTRPGSMGAYVGNELNIPIITLELPADIESNSDKWLWNRYSNCLMTAVNFNPAMEN